MITTGVVAAEAATLSGDSFILVSAIPGWISAVAVLDDEAATFLTTEVITIVNVVNDRIVWV